jgi:hypothetical protein
MTTSQVIGSWIVVGADADRIGGGADRLREPRRRSGGSPICGGPTALNGIAPASSRVHLRVHEYVRKTNPGDLIQCKDCGTARAAA